MLTLVSQEESGSGEKSWKPKKWNYLTRSTFDVATSLVPRLSLRVNEKSNDGKLGGAWERGYVATITPQFVKCQFLIRGFP